MQTILGPFHPFLENALAAELVKCKQGDLLRPLLILVPSDALRRGIKTLLATEREISLLNVPILTFHQLAARLFAETHGNDPAVLRDDRFLEEVVRQILRARRPGAEAFTGVEEKAGGSGALWQTLRDLRDAKLEPEVALEALREGRFSGKTSSRTADLLELYKTLRDFCARKQIEDHSDLDQFATGKAASSPFLAQFAKIFYYGFYDLTQVQVDFFHAVARNFPTTLFFPLLESRPGHDAWSFAERFYRRYVQGLSTSSATNLIEHSGSPLPATFRLFDDSGERAYDAPPENWRVAIANAFGAEDEASAAAKEIVRIVTDGAMGFREIGVVARDLEGYGAAVEKIFNAHQIPIRGAIEESLTQFPLSKAVILLLNLPAKDLLRSQVIDLLSSPYFRLDAAGAQEISPRPDLWDLATRELAICKGISEWRRLRNYQTSGLIFSQLADDDEARRIRIGAEQIRALADLTDALAADLTALPPRATWSQYAEDWGTLFEKYLGIKADEESPGATTEQAVREKILEALEQVAGLDVLDDAVSLAGFSETLQRWLERSSVSARANDVHGVTVLSATAARGLSFRALFILGMNEGVFPRTIREDAFLRDRDREILERDLGYKINQKLAAFDEEKLLFTLLVGAARERLYCSFQRADDSGRPLAPSWYLGELKRALGLHAEEHLKELTIPRSVGDKSEIEPFSREDLLLPEELAVRLSIDAGDPTALIEASGLAANLYKRGRKAVALLDRSSDRLHQLDGMVGPLADYWRRFTARGISPTALETYARCPFQFFARHVLRLERLDLPEESMGPSLGEYGELGHEILKVFYQHLADAGYFEAAPSSVDVEAAIQAIARRIFAEYEAKRPIGYPLTWENVKETLAHLINQVVAVDLRELSTSGYVPTGFEVDRKAELSADWPEPLTGMEIHGRMDRIDGNRAENRLRVIDYKFKFGPQPSGQDKNLYRSALRGQKLQPPFYSLLGKRAAGDGSRSAPPEVEAKFYYIAPRWREGPLVSASFGAEALSGQRGAEVRNTIAYLAGAIREGRFFIQRGDYCSHCDVAEICRKNHPPSLWRAENDPVTAPHRELRGKDSKEP